MDEILKSYPKDVRFVYKQLPLVQIHPNAMPAAKAHVAAGKQGKYWEMHDELFKNFQNLTADTIKKIATDLGLDLAKFEKDMAAPETQKQIEEDMRLAQSIGVSGTPTFFINGKRPMDRSPAGMKAMIDQELAAAKGAKKEEKK